MSERTDRERVMRLELERRKTVALESIAETLIELLILTRDAAAEEGNAV